MATAAEKDGQLRGAGNGRIRRMHKQPEGDGPEKVCTFESVSAFCKKKEEKKEVVARYTRVPAGWIAPQISPPSAKNHHSLGPSARVGDWGYNISSAWGYNTPYTRTVVHRVSEVLHRCWSCLVREVLSAGWESEL